MPLTPFHLGPALLLGVLLYRWLDLPTLLVGSVIVDVRAVLVLFGPLDGPVHGVLTTFAGGLVVAVIVAGAIVALTSSVQSVLDRGRLVETNSVRSSVAAGVAGVYSHVVLDAMLYTDVQPFYPMARNPFFVGDAAMIPVYAGSLFAGLLGIGAYVIRYRRMR